PAAEAQVVRRQSSIAPSSEARMQLPTLPLPLATKRLLIRKPVSSDADAYFALHTDADYIEYVGQAIDRARCDALFAHYLGASPDHLSLAITLQTDGSIAGECVLVPSSPGELELVISIACGHRRAGYAKEA